MPFDDSSCLFFAKLASINVISVYNIKRGDGMAWDGLGACTSSFLRMEFLTILHENYMEFSLYSVIKYSCGTCKIAAVCSKCVNIHQINILRKS